MWRGYHVVRVPCGEGTMWQGYHVARVPCGTLQPVLMQRHNTMLFKVRDDNNIQLLCLYIYTYSFFNSVTYT